jgi:type VI secretion system secreted protein Hcp
MAIYMQFEGIDGGVTAEGHDGWIEMDSLQWGVGRGISMAVGATGKREASTPSVSEISMTKRMDKTTARR